jgi:hypothetical protein
MQTGPAGPALARPSGQFGMNLPPQPSDPMRHINYGLPQNPSARGQFLPAPPASQNVCVVNGFDPAWGVPPSSVWGLPLPFDQSIGAYRFDPEYAASKVDAATLRSLADKQEKVAQQWHTGLMLQPYMRSDAWDFRWIPRLRTMVCPPSLNDLTAPTM